MKPQVERRKVAIVQCAGDCMTVSGDERCSWGCSGDGACVSVCKTGALYINEKGRAQADPEKCTGCGACTKVCPKGLIRLTGREFSIYTACVSRDPGGQTRKLCGNGCIACGICVKNCPAGAIAVEENHAVIDEEKCIACGMCAVKCPRGAIRDFDGIFTVREVQVKK